MPDSTQPDDENRGTDPRTDRPTLEDVDHTPPGGAVGANRVFERGGERAPVTTDGGNDRRSAERDED